MSSITRFSLLLLLLGFGQTSHGASSESTIRACEALKQALPSIVYTSENSQYVSEIQDYWSVALRDLQPECMVLPESTQDVSTAVKILNTFPDVHFAIKSGGHDPNLGHAGSDGVLISMASLKGVAYDKSRNVALVKPGGEWNDVIGSLETEGVAILGGRLGIVGVGGLLLQGGISFLSAQHGLAADNIIAWETVLPNGTIALIDAETQPDLAVAMRGSGSQFGIVTEFTARTYPMGKVWGGTRIYGLESSDQIYAALHDFVPYLTDPKAAIIANEIDLAGGVSILMMFYFYDGPEPPTTGPFSDFLSIPSLVDTTKTQSYAELLRANGETSEQISGRVSFRTFTIPYLRQRPEVYQEIATQWKMLTASYLSDPTHQGAQCGLDFQPFPRSIGAASEARGGNAMGLTSKDSNRLLLEIQCIWNDRADDEYMTGLSRQLTAWLETQVPIWLGNKLCAGPTYLPLLMNDAAGDQNVTGMYRDYAKIKALQEEIDPDGVFRTRVGGYKY